MRHSDSHSQNISRGMPPTHCCRTLRPSRRVRIIPTRTHRRRRPGGMVQRSSGDGPASQEDDQNAPSKETSSSNLGNPITAADSKSKGRRPNRSLRPRDDSRKVLRCHEESQSLERLTNERAGRSFHASTSQSPPECSASSRERPNLLSSQPLNSLETSSRPGSPSAFHRIAFTAVRNARKLSIF